jgi:hypothetical protein
MFLAIPLVLWEAAMYQAAVEGSSLTPNDRNN